MWQHLRQEPFIRFLQTGRAKAETASKAAELLSAAPESGYADALRWALRRYYDDRRAKFNRDQALRDSELQQLRGVLGIAEPPEGPFPDDERLGRLVTIHAPRFTPLEQVVEQLSRSSGIRLGLDPALRMRRMDAGGMQTRTLRKFMHRLGAYDAVWIRDGDGYRLMADPGRGLVP